MARGSRTALVLGLGFVLVAAGCIRQRVEGDTAVYTFEPWLPWAVGVAGVAAVPAGWLLRKKSTFWGYVLIILGPLAAAFLAPTMTNDRVVVSPEEFESVHGVWWSPIKHRHRFEDLSRIHVREEVKTTRSGKDYSYYFDCFGKTGGTDPVPLGDVMKKAAPDVLSRARAKGVPITGLEQLQN